MDTFKIAAGLIGVLCLPGVIAWTLLRFLAPRRAIARWAIAVVASPSTVVLINVTGERDDTAKIVSGQMIALLSAAVFVATLILIAGLETMFKRRA
jgi:hypothetical protein